MTVIAENRRARFDYEILETFEAGIELKGFEVKAAKSGRMSIAGSFAIPENKHLVLINADIPPYQPNNTPGGYDPKRNRNLLLKKEEIAELIGKTHKTSLTIVPLKVYTNHGLVKVELALARPKKKGDKRESLKKRAVEREIGRTLKR